jgi:hypothetical protein
MSRPFNHAFVPERSEEMIEKGLGLALLIASERVRELNELVQRVLKIVSHLCESETSETLFE